MSKEEIKLSELLNKIYQQIHIEVHSACNEAFSQISNNNFQNESVTEENLSSLQASRFLKIKLSTLYSKVAKGELSYSRSGGRKLLFSRKMLEEYVLKRKVKSMDEIKTEAENYINKKYHGGN